MGDTDTDVGLNSGSRAPAEFLFGLGFELGLSLPLSSFLFEMEDGVIGEADFAFFLSDRIGEFDPMDRGLLLEDPSGLDGSDFFDEKNRPLNTIFQKIS